MNSLQSRKGKTRFLRGQPAVRRSRAQSAVAGHSKAQSSVEFVFLVGGALLFIILVFNITRTNLVGTASNQVDLTSKDIQSYLDYIPDAPTGTAVPTDLPAVSA